MTFGGGLRIHPPVSDRRARDDLRVWPMVFVWAVIPSSAPRGFGRVPFPPRLRSPSPRNLRLGDTSSRYGAGIPALVTLPSHRAGGISVSVTLLIVAMDDICASVTLSIYPPEENNFSVTVSRHAGAGIRVSVTVCIPGAAGSPFG